MLSTVSIVRLYHANAFQTCIMCGFHFLVAVPPREGSLVVSASIRLATIVFAAPAQEDQQALRLSDAFLHAIYSTLLALLVMAVLPPPAVAFVGPLCQSVGAWDAADRLVRSFAFAMLYCTHAYASTTLPRSLWSSCWPH